jgi:hypothetical protein
MIIKSITILILSFIFCFTADSRVLSQDDKLSASVEALNKPMAEAKNRKDIKAWMEQNKGFGNPKTKKIKANDKKIFIIWDCPYSGRAATYVYSYIKEGNAWKLALNRLIEGTNDLSVEFDKESNTIIYKSSSGEVVAKQQI